MRKHLTALMATTGLILAACQAPAPFAKGPMPDIVSQPQPTVAALEQRAAPTVAQPAIPTTPDPIFGPDWTRTYELDDGSPLQRESSVRLDNRVVQALGDRVLATWFRTPDGLYRRDPLAGADDVALRFLPPSLVDDLAWKQPSGAEWIWFRLRKSPACVPATTVPDPKTLPAVSAPPVSPTPAVAPVRAQSCWDLFVLNRGQGQRYQFAEGAGIIAASVLVPGNLPLSFHKSTANAGAPAVVPESDRATLVERAMPWDPDRVAPVIEVSAADFAAEAARWLQRTGQVVSGDDLHLLGPWGQWTSTGLWAVGDPAELDWKVLSGDGQPHRFRPVASPRPWVAVETAAADGGFRVRGLLPQFDGYGRLRAVKGWLGNLPGAEARALQVTDAGTLILHRDAGDPLQRTEILEVRLEENDTLTTQVTVTPTAPGAPYPDNPRDVFVTALVAQHYQLEDEYRRYFAAPEAAGAGRLLRSALSPLGLPSTRVLLGRLSDAAQPTGIPTTVTDFPLHHDGSSEFLIVAAKERGADYTWGQVQFQETSPGRWQIGTVSVFGSQHLN